MVLEAKCHLMPEGRLFKTLEWGLAYADRIDPLTPLAKELAEHVAKRQGDAPAPSGETPAPPG